VAFHAQRRTDGDQSNDAAIGPVSRQFSESVNDRRTYDQLMMQQIMARSTITTVSRWVLPDL